MIAAAIVAVLSLPLTPPPTRCPDPGPCVSSSVPYYAAARNGTLITFSGLGWRPRSPMIVSYGPPCGADGACPMSLLIRRFRADGHGRFALRFRVGRTGSPRDIEFGGLGRGGHRVSRVPFGRGSGEGQACHATVTHGVLPRWARAGFSDPSPRAPFALSRAGRMGAILFGDPLQSPPAKGRANKILWVSRAPVQPGANLRLSAQLMRGLRPVGRTAVRLIRGGPGPSIVNLPTPGCWRVTLAWSGQRDVIDLRYR